MAISAVYEDSASISTSEYSLPNDSTVLTPITADGIYQAFIYAVAMVAGDEFQIKVYEKVLAGGTQRVLFDVNIVGPQSGPVVVPSLLLLHGWDITVKKISGTDRTVEWSIRAVI